MRTTPEKNEEFDYEDLVDTLAKVIVTIVGFVALAYLFGGF